jgi:RimJ/RimL family protein N-acetyltransferase
MDGGVVCAAVLVDRERGGASVLTWLTVGRGHRERGLATVMLRLVTSSLHTRGIDELTSAVSAANIPSMRWHLTRGFELAEDPLREALREARSPESLAPAP